MEIHAAERIARIAGLTRRLKTRGWRYVFAKKHCSPTRNMPEPLTFRGTDAKEFPILWTICVQLRRPDIRDGSRQG